MAYFSQAGCVITLLLFWFQTNFVKDYAELFGIQEWLKKFGSDPESGHFLIYDLLAHIEKEGINPKEKFLCKLLTCPFCLGFWLMVSICLLAGNFAGFFPLYVSSMFLYVLFARLIQQ